MAFENYKKMWGKNEFWGVGNDYDPIWLLSNEERAIYEKLIELCRTTIRPLAVENDKSYTFPRKSMDALADLGLLGLITPKEFGGLGGTHVFASMVMEAIARYGCPSTAMVYAMHIGAVSVLLFRYHESDTVMQLLRRINKEKLIGTESYSDPATGGHFWFPLSSKTRSTVDNKVKMLKQGSWCTSSGFADFYVIQTVSPESKGDYSHLDVYLVFASEVRASTSDWKAMGMHGNQSGPLTCEGLLTPDRRIGPDGDGASSNDESVDVYFLMLTACAWNGMALAAIDLAKRHVKTKFHADTGIRVSDYPTIQDYFGENLSSTNSCRLQVLSIAQILDKVTSNNDWSLHKDITFSPRKDYLHWLWQSKFEAAKNVSHVVDKMLHACGGSGYKTDLGLERILRDAKAGWVMGPSNEYLRHIIGKTCLNGMDDLDFWDQRYNKGIMLHEAQKMTNDEKRAFANRLLQEVENNTRGEEAVDDFSPLCEENEYTFDNPFNNVKPFYDINIYDDGVKHGPGLKPNDFQELTLADKSMLGDDTVLLKFNLPTKSDHSGCLPGQYIQMEVEPTGHSPQQRYLSPTSDPRSYGTIEVATRLLSQGLFSQCLEKIKIGETVRVRGPCGGFEYHENTLDHLTLITSGAGVTPAIQIIRGIKNNEHDKTKVTLLYTAANPDQMLFHEELHSIKDDRFRVVMSVMESNDEWNGEEGFIDQKMIEKYVVPAKNQGKHKIVLCGGPTIVVSVLAALRDLDYRSQDMFVYGACGTEQVRMIYGRYAPLSNHSSN